MPRHARDRLGLLPATLLLAALALGPIGCGGSGGEATDDAAGDAEADAIEDETTDDAAADRADDADGAVDTAADDADDTSDAEEADGTAEAEDGAGEEDGAESVDAPLPIRGSIVVNRNGITREVAVTVSGPPDYALVTSGGLAVQTDVPAGTYSARCEDLGGHTLAVAPASGVLDEPGEVLTFTCTYVYAPRYLAVGDGGRIVASVDALIWSEPVVIGTEWLGAVACGPTSCAAGGETWVTTADRLTWNRTPAPPPSGAPIHAVLYARGLFWVGNQETVIHASADLVTWAAKVMPTSAQQVSDLIDSGSVLLGVGHDWATSGGRVWFSTDGNVWTDATPTGLATDGLVAGVGYYDGPLHHFLVAGGGDAWWNFDPSAGWEWNDADPGAASVEAVAAGAGRWVAVGAPRNQVRTASVGDPTAWTTASVSLGRFIALHDVVFADGRFVAVGDEGTILVSADGSIWTDASIGGASLRGVCFVP